eukprot:Gregarina_sp_Pseudo_9__5389@NODE_655_length_2421_cov_6_570109_g618_i0_p3_GENE_NODE_655_length_2421_cov_6_570109_g618_i0NODE_655_length_2421_cov_6_570109_g618_i0_p3_ORF_typecomplete_len160_score4_62Peptidase_S29/PF02907_15/4_3Peptidase_S29/PF02907_15/39_NODE_655_length_2421_cov_6_570109_g618_i07181197
MALDPRDFADFLPCVYAGPAQRESRKSGPVAVCVGSDFGATGLRDTGRVVGVSAGCQHRHLSSTRGHLPTLLPGCAPTTMCGIGHFLAGVGPSGTPQQFHKTLHFAQTEYLACLRAFCIAHGPIHNESGDVCGFRKPRRIECVVRSAQALGVAFVVCSS